MCIANWTIPFTNNAIPSVTKIIAGILDVK